MKLIFATLVLLCGLAHADVIQLLPCTGPPGGAPICQVLQTDPASASGSMSFYYPMNVTINGTVYSAPQTWTCVVVNTVTNRCTADGIALTSPDGAVKILNITATYWHGSCSGRGSGNKCHKYSFGLGTLD